MPSRCARRARTAEAARIVAEGDGTSGPEPGVAAVAPRVAAERYGLEVLAADIADHPGNQTRFVVVAREGVPARDRPRPHRAAGLTSAPTSRAA